MTWVHPGLSPAGDSTSGVVTRSKTIQRFGMQTLQFQADHALNISKALTNLLISLKDTTCYQDMKRIFTLIVALTVAATGFGQRFKPVDQGSEIGFKIRNFGINVSGTFKGLRGKIVFYPDSLSASHFDVTIDVKTINTGIDQRDNHLRSEDYFEVTKYPEIHFVSTRVTTSTNKEYCFVFGNLTIKDVTKEVSFPFKATPQENDFLFEGEFTLNRRDYNVGGGSISMGDNVTLNLKVLAKSEK